MDATVCIPWRSQPDRVAAYNRVCAFWRHHGLPVIMADSDCRQPFQLSEARNRAARHASTEAIIIADADTIPDIASVLEAVELVVRTPGLVIWPYIYYRHISAGYADKSDLFSAPVITEYRNSVGGVLVTTRSTYWDVGGMDERCARCWGFEDNCFYLAASTLASVRRLNGVAFSFDHAVERDTSENNPNRSRWQLYQLVAGKPHLMRELLKR
jgi:Glycosyl transferase family 2